MYFGYGLNFVGVQNFGGILLKGHLFFIEPMISLCFKTYHRLVFQQNTTIANCIMYKRSNALNLSSQYKRVY